MRRNLVIGISPFETPDANLVVAVCRAGAIGVLDLGRNREAGRAAIDQITTKWGRRPFGVRIHAGYGPADVPASAQVIVLPSPVVPIGPWRATQRTIFVQVTSIDEARVAIAQGADALIAKGNESGGRVDEESSYILLQRIVSELGTATSIYVQGGVGLHTAAACIAGGAAGVVLDSQLALVPEASTPKALRDVIKALDGSETVVTAGERVLSRPNLTEPAEPKVTAEPRGHKTDPVVAGQDIAFARGFAERFKTVAGVVRAVTRAIGGHLRLAKELDPIAPGSPLAADLGTTHPIAQGPMTRVSDRAPFAEAVSGAGALPFLALSLMREAEARPLLAEVKATHERLGRSWGVGILGFVPPELRDEQLALIREYRPSVALIAGGRPAQSRPLEDAGIPTFLHVPSPGLLAMFVNEGARRFVLEGRECGGHVGPRSSFVLWESAIETLLADPRCGECSILFAGGIHDARSAAMVAAAAAPLAARGAKLGVLIGTAYLFTREAVASGAIQPAFQDVAQHCDRTVLLDTGPGHSTRCAETEYVRAFRSERERLDRAGVGPREMWEALEQLNLGRLRIAAKGLVRDGAAVNAVGDDVQRREGMFMLGQVAALRRDVVTMSELHRDVAEGSGRVLASLAAPEDDAKPADIAIVGMAAMFPGAPDLATFWKNVLGNVNAITEVPRERFNVDLYYDPQGAGDKTPSKWGGFLADVAFDPAQYGIPPRSLAAIEPVQLLALEVARRALDDAGYTHGRELDRDRASVIFGAEAGTDLSSAYGFRANHRQLYGELPPELDAVLPTLTEDSFPGVLTNVIAGRIANRLDLGGVNYTVDAACASSLAAVDLACKELVAGTSDLVVCGGADLHNGVTDYLMFASVHALSPTGQCKSFDASADGIVLGEGVAALVLKRLADAERDGDRVYAVIKGVGGSSDGKSLGLTAPRQEGQMHALERAYARAGVSPADVELVEAHGTGTVVGDRTELGTLTEIFDGAGARPGRVTLGSVKSQIGHTKCAAGLAGLIKVALSIHHRVLPPTGNLKKLNPGYDGPAASPFLFRDAAHPWASDRRLAGVSAFGFGGTNFHVVLGDAGGDAPEAGVSEWPAELFVIRGADLAAAQETCAQLEGLATSGKPYRLKDLAAGVASRGAGAVQIAFVAATLDDLAARCRSARAGKGSGVSFAGEHAAVRGGKLAMLFPGQGSQRAGMLADLMVAFPAIQAPLRAGRKFAGKIYPPVALSAEERAAQAAAITDTRVAQPALGIVDLATAQLYAAVGVEGAMLGGHSYGELVALAVGGAFGADELIALSEARATCILDAAKGAPGTMAAVRGTADAIRAALGGDSGVVLANLNAPDQVVIAGPDDAIDAACAKLGAAGLTCRRLPVAAAFHSPVVAGGAVTFAHELARVDVRAPSKPVYANSSASPYPDDAAGLRFVLAQQIAQPVRFAEEIEAMYAAGARIFVEAGPGGVLTNLVGRILGDRPHLAVSTDRSGEPGVRAFLQALAPLAAAGVPIDTAALFAGRGVQAIDLAAPPHVGPSPMAWLVNGQRAKPMAGELPEFAMKPVLGPVAIAARGGAGGVTAPSEREGAVLEYLRAMRELVEGQKQVMLRYLGDTTPIAQQPAARPVIEVVEVAKPVQLVAAPVAAVAVSRKPLDVLVAIVSDRTGYPKEMLDPDLDLEADLGIDSIKRIEILGTLGEQLDLGPAEGGKKSDMLEELTQIKTLRAIAAWIEEKTGATSPPPAEPQPQLAAGSVPAVAAEPESPALTRYVLAVEPIAPALPNGLALADRTFAITDDGRGLSSRLAALLAARGAKTRIADATAPLGAVDGLIHLAPLSLRPVSDARKALFAFAKEAVAAGAQWLYAATPLGGVFGHAIDGGADGPARIELAHSAGGVAGLLKSIAKEFPALRVRSIDLDLHDSPDALDRAAADFLAEMLSDDRHVEVGYRGGVRHGVRAVAANGIAQTGTMRPLGRDAVVLLTGGARGITAAAAIRMAERFGCALELVGRSPMPSDEEPDRELAGADAQTLRKILAERVIKASAKPQPAAIEAEVARLLAAAEVRRTMATLRRAIGDRLRYHALDVRDGAAFGALLDDVYARHGRLDGVIHGAGIIEDRLLRDKTAASFDRVFDTKVASARTLVDKLRPDVRFVVFFSSISGAFGNRGQTDYAAANDALDKLAHQLRRRVSGHVVSINWGPWAGGMVSPELERESIRRGIGLIGLDEGVDHLLDEVLHGSSAQVIITRVTPEKIHALLDPRPADGAS